VSLKQIKENLNVNGLGLTKRDQEAMEKWTAKGDVGKENAVDTFSEPMKCFTFESVIRPLDNALVIHLKHLPPALRNAKFFDFATEFVRDRIGKFRSLDASFIGELDSANKLNSLDMIFTNYYPAQRGDMDYIRMHTVRIGKELDEILVREIGSNAIISKH